MAYQIAGDDDVAEKVADENYARHPDYLFAKLNVAQFALIKGDVANPVRYGLCASMLMRRFVALARS
jgi:hypothetical protein